MGNASSALMVIAGAPVGVEPALPQRRARLERMATFLFSATAAIARRQREVYVVVID